MFRTISILICCFACVSPTVANSNSLPKVALLPFYAPDQYQKKAEILSAMLEMTLLRENSLEILDRKHVSSLLEETEIELGSSVSEERNIKTGKLIGADYLIQGIVAADTNKVPVIHITVLDSRSATVYLRTSRIIPVDHNGVR